MIYVKDILEKIAKNEMTLELGVGYLLQNFDSEWLKDAFPRKDLIEEINRQEKAKRMRKYLTEDQIKEYIKRHPHLA